MSERYVSDSLLRQVNHRNGPMISRSRNTHKLRQERFRIISRRAVNRVNQMNAYIPYRKAMYMNCGLRAETIVYDNKEMAKGTRNREERNTRSSLALDTLIIFTDVLEKFSMLISSILFAVMVIMFGWIVYSIFSTVRPVEGWMSLMTLISFGFFMIFKVSFLCSIYGLQIQYACFFAKQKSTKTNLGAASDEFIRCAFFSFWHKHCKKKPVPYPLYPALLLFFRVLRQLLCLLKLQLGKQILLR